MQRYIFEPLGIKDMSMFPDEDMKSRALAMEQRLPDGNLAVQDHAWKYALNVREPGKPNTVRSGGAGLFGSPREYSSKLLPGLSCEPS
jgi:CubicO group peptidase (beta-lactamase class C family)